MISTCGCHNAFQDKYYGKGRRVFNKMGKKDTMRCTVCETIKTAPKEEE